MKSSLFRVGIRFINLISSPTLMPALAAGKPSVTDLMTRPSPSLAVNLKPMLTFAAPSLGRETSLGRERVLELLFLAVVLRANGVALDLVVPLCVDDRGRVVDLDVCEMDVLRVELEEEMVVLRVDDKRVDALERVREEMEVLRVSEATPLPTPSFEGISIWMLLHSVTGFSLTLAGRDEMARR